MSDFNIIDSDNYKASGIDTFFFPGGEPHVKIPDFNGTRQLAFLKLRTWNDFGLARMFVDACYQSSAAGLFDLGLFVPYLPGARQDRSDGFSPLTADLYRQDLSYGHFPVFTFDVHSNPDGSPIERNYMPADLDLSSLRGKYSGVIAPDAGARDRAISFAQEIEAPRIKVAEKQRDFATGRITGYDLPLHGDECGRWLVVDDICDGGATFNILADSTPADIELDLWVSHGIFSRGVSALSPRYKRIYTTDSWYQSPEYVSVFDREDTEELARVTVFSLAQLFNRIME